MKNSRKREAADTVRWSYISVETFPVTRVTLGFFDATNKNSMPATAF